MKPLKKRIVIVGSSFSGYTTAVTLADKIKSDHEIIVIDSRDKFLFMPSFAGFPFDFHPPENFSFDTKAIYQKMGITFIKDEVLGFDPDDHLVFTQQEDITYDYLVIATGLRPRYESVKGYIPGETAWSICDLKQSFKTREAWEKYLENPGPMVIGISQWAGYFFAAYEFLANVVFQLRKNGLLGSVPVTFITPEPYSGHMGAGELFRNPSALQRLFEKSGIQTRLNAEIKEIKSGSVVMGSGEEVRSDFSMIIPQFIGIDAVRTTRNLSDRHGMIDVDEEFRHKTYSDIYASGGSMYIPEAEDTPVPLGVPRTHHTSKKMAQVLVHNLSAELGKGKKIRMSKSLIHEHIANDLESMCRLLFMQSQQRDGEYEFMGLSAKERWTNTNLSQYIESSFGTEYLNLDN